MTVESSSAAADGEAVVGRVIATGVLTLRAPAHFGGGAGDTTDAQLLRAADGRPFLPGASLAGACRGFLRRQGVANTDLELLFGGMEVARGRGDQGRQSTLSVDDAFPPDDRPLPTTVRDRVRLDPRRRAAADQGKFDYEVLAAGAQFALRLEVTLRAADAARFDRLRLLLNVLLDALEYGDIRLGAHTRRGLGQAEVAYWRVLELDFHRRPDVVRWLRSEAPSDGAPQRCGGARPGAAIADAALHPPPYLYLSADLALIGPVMVRATPPANAPGAPDAVQFQAGGTPVIPGTSLAGALRQRARRICNTLAGDDARADTLVDGVFGPGFRGDAPPAQPRASRLRVEEAPIQNGRLERQTRIAIDRFTGGTLSAALLEEVPVWSGADEPATLRLALRLDALRPEEPGASADAERGLLLLLLKDLCTGDLPVGGEAAVGRGVLRGLGGTIELHDGGRLVWRWRPEGDRIRLIEGDRDLLSAWVAALARSLEGEGDVPRAE